MKKIISIAGLLVLITLSYAQNIQSKSSDLIDPTLNERQNQFLNDEAEALLLQANRVLTNYPPGWPEPINRRSALLLLDGVFHDVYAPHRPAVQSFLKSRIKKAVNEIEQTEILNGARIWKLYNHGLIIRTRSLTIGFDLVSGKSANIEGFSVEIDDINRLINQCDVLFISHLHKDHAEESIAQFFINQGKPVVAPPGVWKDKPIYTQITHLKRVSNIIQPLSVKNGQEELKVIVYPGHQGENTENNVYLVITPEGLSFSQMGDQYNHDDFEWIDEVKNNYVVDILMPNCWTEDIARVAKGFNPAIIITGHENEMGHTIDHREPYWLSYQRKGILNSPEGNNDPGYDCPLILMTWGESYYYKKENYLK